MKNPTSLVTAIRNRDTGTVMGIVDEDGKYIEVADRTPAAITANATLSAADNGGRFYNATATARTITVAPGLPAGFTATFAQNSTGAITIAPGGGVTILSNPTISKTAGAGSLITLTQTAANVYNLSGGGAA